MPGNNTGGLNPKLGAILARLCQRLGPLFSTQAVIQRTIPLWLHAKPSAYHVPKISSDIQLCEYRCDYPLRVIVRWIGPSEEEPEGAVLLVAATLSHQHDRLKEIISNHRAGFR